MPISHEIDVHQGGVFVGEVNIGISGLFYTVAHFQQVEGRLGGGAALHGPGVDLIKRCIYKVEVVVEQQFCTLMHALQTRANLVGV